MKMYIDGAMPATTVSANSGFGSFTNRPWRIGTDTHTTPVDFFNGGLDDVRIYNRVLSDSEIQQLYNAGR
jgi:hypothetical protein